VSPTLPVGSTTNAADRPDWIPPTPGERLAILRSIRTVAIVGASSNPARPSNFVATYLLSSSTDYTVWLVNPREDQILGHRVYPSVFDLPEPPDVIDVFRRPEDLEAVAQEAVDRGSKVLWLQLGLFSEGAARVATSAGLQVVMNRCLKIEHARFAGGLHLAGFDTGVISSRKRLA
jgi:predicted CoA-binding protein